MNVRFRYPTRSDIKVLRDFTLSIKPGQTVALVGTSGCGKSTSVALVERLYDINSGSLVRGLRTSFVWPIQSFNVVLVIKTLNIH